MRQVHLDVWQQLRFRDVVVDMRELAELNANPDGVETRLPVVLTGCAIVSRPHIAFKRLLQFPEQEIVEFWFLGLADWQIGDYRILNI